MLRTGSAGNKEDFPSPGPYQVLFALTAPGPSMLSSLLYWLFTVVPILGAFALAWYQSAHSSHPPGFRPLVYLALGLVVAGAQLGGKIQESRKSRGRLSGQEFLAGYVGLLTDAIEALQDLGEYNEAQLRQAQRKILQLICSVIELFYEDKTELSINANLMDLEPVEEHSDGHRFRDNVFFHDPQREPASYAGVLCVIVWANNPQGVTPRFSLPLDRDEGRILFGAPQTYHSGREVVLNDIRDRGRLDRLLDGQPNVIKSAVCTYFEGQRYRSFASIPVNYADNTIAVLNVQSDKTHIFGRRPQQATEMKKYIDPFCAILGILVAHQAERRQDHAGQPDRGRDS